MVTLELCVMRWYYLGERDLVFTLTAPGKGSLYCGGVKLRNHEYLVCNEALPSRGRGVVSTIEATGEGPLFSRGAS